MDDFPVLREATRNIQDGAGRSHSVALPLVDAADHSHEQLGLALRLRCPCKSILSFLDASTPMERGNIALRPSPFAAEKCQADWERQEGSPESCWTSGLLKGVMKRLLWTLSSTRDAAMTCNRIQVGMLLVLMEHFVE